MERQAELSTHTYYEWKKRKTWRDYIEITKPGINVNNLFVTLAGFLLASGYHSSFAPGLLIITLIGTACIIAGSCVLNNFYDRDIDQLMERTKSRPIASGRIHPTVALWFGISLLSSGILTLFFAVNPLAAGLGLIGSVVYVFVYTMWLKRSSTSNTVIGGISGAVPPLIGWVAVTGSLDLAAWALFCILFFWQPPHFFALAMLKVDDYQNANIPMLPVKEGNTVTKKQTLFYTAFLLPSSVLLFYTGVVGWFFLVAAVILGGIYLVLAWKGLFTKQDYKWARQMFLYSLIYLVAILSVMIIDVFIRGVT